MRARFPFPRLAMSARPAPAFAPMTLPALLLGVLAMGAVVLASNVLVLSPLTFASNAFWARCGRSRRSTSFTSMRATLRPSPVPTFAAITRTSG